MPPVGLPPKAEEIIADLRDQLALAQENYKLGHGRYWQGRQTPAIVPSAGGWIPASRDSRPTDQAESWADMGLDLPGLLDVALATDAYDGPRGQGYVVVSRVIILGRLFEKRVNVGPETYRDMDWTDVTPEIE